MEWEGLGWQSQFNNELYVQFLQLTCVRPPEVQGDTAASDNSVQAAPAQSKQSATPVPIPLPPSVVSNLQGKPLYLKGTFSVVPASRPGARSGQRESVRVESSDTPFVSNAVSAFASAQEICHRHGADLEGVDGPGTLDPRLWTQTTWTPLGEITPVGTWRSCFRIVCPPFPSLLKKSSVGNPGSRSHLLGPLADQEHLTVKLLVEVVALDPHSPQDAVILWGSQLIDMVPHIEPTDKIDRDAVKVQRPVAEMGSQTDPLADEGEAMDSSIRARRKSTGAKELDVGTNPFSDSEKSDRGGEQIARKSKSTVVERTTEGKANSDREADHPLDRDGRGEVGEEEEEPFTYSVFDGEIPLHIGTPIVRSGCTDSSPTPSALDGIYQALNETHSEVEWCLGLQIVCLEPKPPKDSHFSGDEEDDEDPTKADAAQQSLFLEAIVLDEFHDVLRRAQFSILAAELELVERQGPARGGVDSRELLYNLAEDNALVSTFSSALQFALRQRRSKLKERDARALSGPTGRSKTMGAAHNMKVTEAGTGVKLGLTTAEDAATDRVIMYGAVQHHRIVGATTWLFTRLQPAAIALYPVSVRLLAACRYLQRSTELTTPTTASQLRSTSLLQRLLNSSESNVEKDDALAGKRLLGMDPASGIPLLPLDLLLLATILFAWMWDISVLFTFLLLLAVYAYKWHPGTTDRQTQSTLSMPTTKAAGTERQRLDDVLEDDPVTVLIVFIDLLAEAVQAWQMHFIQFLPKGTLEIFGLGFVPLLVLLPEETETLAEVALFLLGLLSVSLRVWGKPAVLMDGLSGSTAAQSPPFALLSPQGLRVLLSRFGSGWMTKLLLAIAGKLRRSPEPLPPSPLSPQGSTVGAAEKKVMIPKIRGLGGIGAESGQQAPGSPRGMVGVLSAVQDYGSPRSGATFRNSRSFEECGSPRVSPAFPPPIRTPLSARGSLPLATPRSRATEWTGRGDCEIFLVHFSGSFIASSGANAEFILRFFIDKYIRFRSDALKLKEIRSLEGKTFTFDHVMVSSDGDGEEKGEAEKVTKPIAFGNATEKKLEEPTAATSSVPPTPISEPDTPTNSEQLAATATGFVSEQAIATPSTTGTESSRPRRLGGHSRARNRGVPPAPQPSESATKPMPSPSNAESAASTMTRQPSASKLHDSGKAEKEAEKAKEKEKEKEKEKILKRKKIKSSKDVFPVKVSEEFQAALMKASRVSFQRGSRSSFPPNAAAAGGEGSESRLSIDLYDVHCRTVVAAAYHQPIHDGRLDIVLRSAPDSGLLPIAQITLNVNTY